MRTLKLYGPLADFVGATSFDVEVANIAESVRFLLANFPALEPHMVKQNYCLRVGEHEIGEDGIHHPIGQDETIEIIPVISGAGAAARIIGGAVLVGLSFLIPGAALFGVGLAPIALGIGASLVLGGVSQLLMPTPQTNLASEKDPRSAESYSFSGIQNVSRQGMPVPIGYGECIVGSIVITAGLTSEYTIG
jgi:predicted phage tail protein